MDILAQAVKNCKSLYPNQNYFITYNNLKENQLNQLKKLDVQLIDQTKEKNYLNAKTCTFALIPGRIDIEAPEIFMDNDVVMARQHPLVNELIKGSTKAFVTEGLFRLFGKYDNQVPKGLKINSGFFGLPAGVNVEAAVKSIVFNTKTKEEHFDFQGLVAALITRQKKYQIIPLEEVPVCRDFMRVFQTSCYAYHFVGANRLCKHNGWKLFLASGVKLL